MIYLISSEEYNLSTTLDIEQIVYTNQTTHAEIHDFVLNQIGNKTGIQAFVIPINLREEENDFVGLRLGLHIRLSIELGEKRFLPLIFLSDIAFEDKSEILHTQIKRNDELTAMLLFTAGVSFISPEEFDIHNLPIALNEDSYRKKFLPHIQLKRPSGTHSLANQWGIVRLAETCGFYTENDLQDRLKEALQTLFFKHLSITQNIYLQNSPDQKIISAQGKKILLIDDEAKKGWETILKKIFEGAIIHIETSDEYNNFSISNKNNIKNGYYDLFLLDLRLNPTEEEKTEFIQKAKTTEYSGAKILQEIKTQNPGNQVIVFTASNKAWNLKELMQAGYEADGYYMKESPDFYFDADFSQKNFENLKNEAEKCFEKGYLRKMYKEIEIIKGDINTLNPYNAKSSHVNEFNKCKIEILIQLDIAFRQIKLVQVNNDFPYAFICFFQILEILQKENFLVYMRDILFKNRIQVNAYQINKQNQFVQAGDEDSIFSIIVSISKELDINDNNLFWALHYDIQRRHKFIHKEISQDIEFQKIYTSTATVELWGRIKTILEKLPLSPIP